MSDPGAIGKVGASLPCWEKGEGPHPDPAMQVTSISLIGLMNSPNLCVSQGSTTDEETG